MIIFVFLLLITINCLNCEDPNVRGAELGKLLKKKDEYRIEDQVFLKGVIKDYQENTTENQCNLLESYSKIKKFQILDSREEMFIQDAISFQKTDFEPVGKGLPKNKFDRLTYRSVFNLSLDQSKSLFSVRKHHLSIGERLLLQSSQILIQTNRGSSRKIHRIKNSDDLNKLNGKGDLQDAIKESISNAATKNSDFSHVNKIPENPSGLENPLKLELKEIEILKKKNDIQSGKINFVSEMIKKINSDINHDCHPNQRTVSTNIDLNVPVPPSKEDSLEVTGDLSENVENKETQVNKLPLIVIPKVDNFIEKNESKKSNKKNRPLPPGAQEELEEFLSKSKRETQSTGRAYLLRAESRTLMNPHKTKPESGTVASFKPLKTTDYQSTKKSASATLSKSDLKLQSELERELLESVDDILKS